MKQNYLPLGINKIKLAGRREEQTSLAGQYVNILMKQEYREEVYSYLISSYSL